MTKKQILLNAFNMNCVGHINHGLWTHPRDTSTAYKTLDYWTGLARLLERGLFDGLFLADIVGVYDVPGLGRPDPARSIQLPVNDPLLIVPAMAAATRHLGFGVTVNLTYEAPYLLARRFSTLDHLTQGRVGWNIVTGYLESAARAMGRPGRSRTTSATTAPTNSWTWPISCGKAAGTRTRSRPTSARGSMPIPPPCAGWTMPANTIVFKAITCRAFAAAHAGAVPGGLVGPGLAFAARHAECVFVSSQTKRLRKLVSELREAVAREGRDPRDIKFFMGITAVVGRTEREARDKHAEYLRYASPEAGLAHYASSTGIDFSTYAPDEPIRYVKNNAIESAVRSLTVARTDRTVRDLLADMALGGRYPALVGSAAQVADELESWVAETGIDGFNLARTVTPECYEDFIDLVIPELQSRGSYKTAYADGTLREKLFGAGRAALPDVHAGARARPPTPERAARMRGR